MRSIFIVSLVFGSLVGCGGTVVVEGEGGASSSSATNGQNACDSATARIVKKLGSCGIAATGLPPSTTCGPLEGSIETLLADCTEKATCEALSGKDLVGAQSYLQCLSAPGGPGGG